jgi:hypothetical protein
MLCIEESVLFGLGATSLKRTSDYASVLLVPIVKMSGRSSRLCRIVYLLQGKERCGRTPYGQHELIYINGQLVPTTWLPSLPSLGSTPSCGSITPIPANLASFSRICLSSAQDAGLWSLSNVVRRGGVPHFRCIYDHHSSFPSGWWDVAPGYCEGGDEVTAPSSQTTGELGIVHQHPRKRYPLLTFGTCGKGNVLKGSVTF